MSDWWTDPKYTLLETVNHLLWRYETDENYTVQDFTAALWAEGYRKTGEKK